MFSRFWAGKAAILLDLDHLGVSLTNAQLVVADGQLHGVAQRCDLTDVDLTPLVRPLSMMRRLTGPSPCRRLTVAVSPTLTSLRVFIYDSSSIL